MEIIKRDLTHAEKTVIGALSDLERKELDLQIAEKARIIDEVERKIKDIKEQYDLTHIKKELKSLCEQYEEG